MHRDALAEKIRVLAREKNAVILAHNYQLGEIQDVADHTGDSLELSRIAAGTDADVIVFCGVRFMAETAHILAPRKTVLNPEPEATCWMAAMIDAPALIAFRDQHPGVPVVCYVNSTADVKAASDICCTSANAEAVIASLPGDRAIFVPDRNLGAWVASRTGKEIILWPGYCLSHVRILPADIERCRAQFPKAVVVVHPECVPAVVAMADHVLSTGGMVRFALKTHAPIVIVGTEVGMLHRLGKERPDVTFIAASQAAICPNMKLTSLESVLNALEGGVPPVEVPTPVREKAARAVERMVELG
jgi:quinolinate synthase